MTLYVFVLPKQLQNKNLLFVWCMSRDLLLFLVHIPTVPGTYTGSDCFLYAKHFFILVIIFTFAIIDAINLTAVIACFRIWRSGPRC